MDKFKFFKKHYKALLSQDEVQQFVSLIPFEFGGYVAPNTRRMQCPMCPKTSPVVSAIETMILPRTEECSQLFDKSRVQFRKYVQTSFMDWHVDFDQLGKENFPIFELILTLSNTTDSFTEFKGEDGSIEQIYTEPGDLLIVTRHGIAHRVTEVTNHGELLILMFRCI